MKEMLVTIPRRGGGTDGTYIFHGETDSLISYSDLSTHFGVTNGTLMTGTEINKWLSFTLDDKELFVSKIPVRHSISWNQIYSRGLVYGSNDNGRYPTGTPTNQYRTITLNGKLYKCRLLKGVDTDPTTLGNGFYLEGSHNSEWSRLLYPLITNDTYLNSSYTGIKYPTYTNAELGINNSNGSYMWCQESNTTARVYRGYTSVTYLFWTSSSNVDGFRGWRACLELV